MTYPLLDLVKGHHGRGVVLIVVVLHCLSDAGLDEVLNWSSLQAFKWIIKTKMKDISDFHETEISQV